MLAGPCLIISDAHLGVAPPDAERSLLAFLSDEAPKAKSLVLNGDMFDFWFEWRSVMPRTGFRLLSALSALRERGTEIVWIAGNHDCWGGDLLSRDVGVTYHVGPWRGEIAGWNTLIEHGDGLRDVEDAPYRRLRAVFRNPLAIWAFRNLLHPDWATSIAGRFSHTSRGMRPRDGDAGLRSVAERRLSEDRSLDLYVFGHTHMEALSQTDGGAVYGNPGAWLDAPQWLRVDGDAVSLVRGGITVSSLRRTRR